MKKKAKLRLSYSIPAFIFGAVFKQAEFTKEQVELYFDLDYYFLKHLKGKKGFVNKLVKYHTNLKKAIIKNY